jgi:hypothetical protein
MILTLTSYTDVNDWLTENYQGIIYEGKELVEARGTLLIH